MASYTLTVVLLQDRYAALPVNDSELGQPERLGDDDDVLHVVVGALVPCQALIRPVLAAHKDTYIHSHIYTYIYIYI